MPADAKRSFGYRVITEWLATHHRQPFLFQEQTWQAILNGQSGLVNAPTGCGKTYSVLLGALIDFINRYPRTYQSKSKNGLQLLWISPLRALAKDIGRAMKDVIEELGMKWQVGIRNGDTGTGERQKQKNQMPEVLIITPESLHLLLAQKGYADLFRSLKIIAVDEWHELMGSKRGVQVELAISRIASVKRQSATSYQQMPIQKGTLLSTDGQLVVWGISATIGNLEEAKDVLLAPLSILWNNNTNKENHLSKDSELVTCAGESRKKGTKIRERDGLIIRADLKKSIEVTSIFPDEIEFFPWSGHLGTKLIDKVIPIILQSKSTLIFINTRGMCETWYQKILDACPDLAGSIALHHGSIDMNLRQWVEENLNSGKLKAVVCTSSLDLGVDFRPVETVIQVGSPKGVARFLQRAGRSGHSPDAMSKIYFLPTHSLELMEAAALKAAIKEDLIESRQPMIRCFDVLIQFINTLAISDGFIPDEIFSEITSTHCYKDITKNEWLQLLHFCTAGGRALKQYDEFKKIEIENGIYRITNRRTAMRHRLHIGTIVSEAMLKVKFMSGGYIGVIEEWFVSRLLPGDVFTLSGKNLEYTTTKEMTVLVKKSNSKKSKVPSWQGGRMPLSAHLGKKLREQLTASAKALPLGELYKELEILKPLFELQQKRSHVPLANELLIEHIETKDGFHLFVYPFEGRLVHEAMAALLAYRISRFTPITFSIAMNDYGFELLSDRPIPVNDTNVYELFSADHLITDIQRSVNATEMARRKFRDVAVIGGLIFQGMPGEKLKARHLQASASLLFNVFSEYEPDNLLIRQSYQEVFDLQMEEVRLRDMLQRIQCSKIIIKYPEHLTPFCFPIKVDSMREDISSEKLEDRVKKIQQQLNV